MIDGTPKYTALAIGEFSCNVLGNTVKLTAKAAFVDPRAGTTHGWTSCEHWSPATIAKMREFMEMMELDLARQHFRGEAAPQEVDTRKPQGIPEGGLGEHVGDDEQV